ncbi:MAG: RNA polymerase sigma-70 factor (ECF subfamily) [Lentimonas sp.]|jgi:RNA polymerase sigma-70 factor (ECF subfamily)
MNNCDSTYASIWTIDSKQSNANMHSKMDETTSRDIEDIEDIDSVCLRTLAEGDHSLFRSLIERWQNRLINFFYRSTQNLTDAEDLVQETFLDLYKAAARYQNKGTFNAFIFTLARRRLIDSYRKRASRPLDFIDPTDSFMQQHSEQADRSLEIEDAFQRALATLPENQRSAILLLKQQELSYDEIAKSLNASLSSVKTWIHRARTHLRQKLKDFA